MSRPTMRVLCVFGPLDGQTMDVNRWTFAADATPAANVRDFDPSAPVLVDLAHYTVRRVWHADYPQRALLAVLDGHEPSPEKMPALYARAVRAGCVEPETP